MFTPCGIAKADDLRLIVLQKHHIIAAIAGGFEPFCPEHAGGWLRTAGGKEDEGQKAFHPASLARGWLRRG
jgi:hypothetical protein